MRITPVPGPRQNLAHCLALCLAWLLSASACTTPDPSDPEIIATVSEARNLGLAFLEENRLDEAEAEFRKIVQLTPRDASGHANLGIVYLRRGEFEEAESALIEARSIDPADPSISLSLAEVYNQLEQPAQARNVIDEAVTHSPDHVPTRYKRAQLYAQTDSAAAFMGDVVERAPANIVPRLFYIEALVQQQNADSALAQLSQAQQQLPEVPREAAPHMEDAMVALQSNDLPTAGRSTRIFHNLLKVTPYYQTGLRLLGMRTDALAGVPVISEPAGLTQSAFFEEDQDADILDQIRLEEVAQNAQLSGILPESETLSALALADLDADGETDVMTASWNESAQQSTLKLLINQFGRFTDATSESGLTAGSSPTRYAIFADYDNDTFLDLFLVNEGPNQLFRNNGLGVFEDVSDKAGINVEGGVSSAFADLDHDGDLDLIVVGEGPNQVFRNNADGTFTEQAAEMGLAGAYEGVLDIDFGDFDDDGDLDLILTGNAGARLYSNERQGRFVDVTEVSGIKMTPAIASAAGDFNNDGFLDLAIVSASGLQLFANLGEFQFEAVNAPVASGATDAQFIDIDNDGFLDIFLAGAPVQIFHNDGNGAFSDVSNRLFGETPLSASRLAVTDYNLDRDLDIFLTTGAGIRLLRNDGGHLNRSLSVQTRGLLTNNSKNNYFSIGAKVEVRAGDLYQMRVVTSPVTHFGIGKRLKADVVRIVFTNGVPQNIFRPGSDQDIIEQQILKGSCPFLYTWNGSEYTFATDILWRSALGMPLGILGGERAYAPASPAEDYIRITDGLLVESEGRYRMQITGELWETPFFDEIKLIAIDHPDSLDLWVDEHFGPARPDPWHVVSRSIPLKSAKNERGRDLLQTLQFQDSVYTGPLRLTPYQGLTELHDLVLQPGAELDPENAVLYLQGWIFPTDASINVALSQSDRFKPVPPQVQVMDETGSWQTVINNMGFPMGKNKTVRVDLSGRFLSSDHRVRIRTNMEIYWDYAFFAEEAPPESLEALGSASRRSGLRISRLPVSRAELYYRGFSRMYRTSPFGPHLFDFSDVDKAPRWRDLTGLYTRFGDVTPLLQASDDQYAIMNAGDAIELSFDAGALPPLSDGQKRSFVLYSNGWLKDGDLNTAHGDTVEPLPFRNMSAYPYGDGESYPLTSANRTYLTRYNTRVVPSKTFDKTIRPD